MEFQQEILAIEKLVAGPTFQLTSGPKRDDLVGAPPASE